MTMDALKKAMNRAVDEYLDDYIFEGKSKEEIEAEKETMRQDILDDIVTEEVLNHINDNLTFVPVVDIDFNGENIMSDVFNDEMAVGHGINYVEKMFDCMAFLIGTTDESFSCNSFCYVSGICSYVTVNGDWKFTEYDSICDTFDVDPSFIITHQKDTNETYYGLDNLSDIIPSKYDGELYGWR